MTHANDLDPEQITTLLSVFYGRVRKDPEIGPVFNRIVDDWDEHLTRLEDFWSSLMLASGRYKGNPLAMHALHSDLITPTMFDSWLAIWARTTDELLPPDIASIMQTKAHRIAERLKTVMYEPSHGEATVTPRMHHVVDASPDAPPG